MKLNVTLIKILLGALIGMLSLSAQANNHERGVALEDLQMCSERDAIKAEDTAIYYYCESLSTLFKSQALQDKTQVIYRLRAFFYHQIQTIAIFILVVILVLSGIYFSWLKFSQYPQKGKEASSHSIEIANLIKLDTDAIGLIVLVISLLFFYLYVDKVYPIVTLGVG